MVDNELSNLSLCGNGQAKIITSLLSTDLLGWTYFVIIIALLGIFFRISIIRRLLNILLILLSITFLSFFSFWNTQVLNWPWNYK